MYGRRCKEARNQPFIQSTISLRSRPSEENDDLRNMQAPLPLPSEDEVVDHHKNHQANAQGHQDTGCYELGCVHGELLGKTVTKLKFNIVA